MSKLTKHIRAATGQEKADLVIKNVKMLDVITGKVETTDIAISDNQIVGTYEEYSGATEIDGSDLYAVP